MPRYEGVYKDTQRGRWYFKVAGDPDALTGRRRQITRRGYATAAEAAEARRQMLEGDAGAVVRSPGGAMRVAELLEQYFAYVEATHAVSTKTLYDYRDSAKSYVLPTLGAKKLGELTPTVLSAWQAQLMTSGGRRGQGLSANTVRLARAPLAAAWKWGLQRGLVAGSPLASVARPVPPRKVARHWSPEQAREFLDLMTGDRLYPVYAFLLGSGLRIGELVWLRWPSVDLERKLVRVVDFAATLRYGLAPSFGKSRDAVRTIELDEGLVRVLRQQAELQAAEREAAADYEPTDYVFTKQAGGCYHPQYLSQTLARYSVECGLPRLTAHGLRHTCATLMLATGVPPKVAAERLGHADPTLFTNLYSHVTPTMQREAAERIGSALFG